MRTTRVVTVSLDPETADALDRRAKRGRQSRSEVVRAALIQYERQFAAWDELSRAIEPLRVAEGLDTEEKVAAYAVEAVRAVRRDRRRP